jgi:RNA polymerase sigma factor (TIGR02999 family)
MGRADHTHDVTRLLADLGSGDRAAAAELLPLVYEELRRLAVAEFARQPAGHTLQPTAVVHEAWLKLARQTALELKDRRHFFVLASKVMRQILVDHARSRAAAKRGGGVTRIELGTPIEANRRPDLDVLALEEALSKLTYLSEPRARLVELRFYGGLSEEEAAEALAISRTEAARQWRAVKAWLAAELREDSVR